MNDWLNIIFKMMDDGISNETIYFYIQRQPGFHESKQKLGKYIYLIGKNNFPARALFNGKYLMEWVTSPDVIVLKRTEILKYLLTCNPKVKKDEKVGMYIDVVKEKYPVAGRVESIFKEFHGTIMGAEPDKLEDFLKKYEYSEIKPFCNGIKKDIAPVKNAISYSVSSGFVEGNNNKFKLLKRIVYGRSGLVNLAKKCKLAFLPKNKDFSLSTLI
ncbi:MAG TPA: transposase [Ruminiclostridium sp.]